MLRLRAAVSPPSEARQPGETDAEQCERGGLRHLCEERVTDDLVARRGRMDSIPEEILRRITSDKLGTGVRHVRQSEGAGIRHHTVHQAEQIKELHVRIATDGAE